MTTKKKPKKKGDGMAACKFCGERIRFRERKETQQYTEAGIAHEREVVVRRRELLEVDKHGHVCRHCGRCQLCSTKLKLPKGEGA